MDSKTLDLDLKGELELYMDGMRKKNRLDIRGGFISLQFLKQLFTAEKIKEQLSMDFELRPYELSELEEFVRKHAKLVYAILILINKSKLIRKFKKCQPPVNDVLLFKASEGESRSFCTKEALGKIPELSDSLDSFFATQWVFPPPLSTTETLFFDERFFKFPFMTAPTRLGNGGYGHVYGVDMHGDFLQESDNFKPGDKVVYKKLTKESQGKDGWKMVMREVKTLRARQHSNITPLLGSFRAGLEVPSNLDSNTQCLYLISPRASMDMHVWMQEKPVYLKDWDDHKLRVHIWDAMRGLISGLTYIHREIGGNVGYHADLKPKNILLFDTPGHVWKICDFGTANIKSIDDTRTKSFTTTRYWAPTEFFMEEYRHGQNHGRAHDVWSLGCIFLLLATIAKHKWEHEGNERFEELRKKENEEGAFHSSKVAVLKWIQNLKTGNQGTLLTKVVELVEEMLKRRTERIFSWEVEVDLHHIIDEEGNVLTHLGEVIQTARDVDRQMQHNPLTRAKRKNREVQWLDILIDHGWYDEQTTEEQKRARIVDRSVSAFPPPDKVAPIGRGDLLESISKAFTKTSSVTLYGVGGMGKSLIARHYVYQRIARKEERPIKHMFWVQAQSISLFEESYRAISTKLELQDRNSSNEDQLFKAVKFHLENESMEPWFMVVDGLDHPREATFIEPLLPVSDIGRILITTKHSYMIRKMDQVKLGAFLEVKPPNEAMRLEILRRHIDEALVGATEDHARKVVNTFCSPNAIKLSSEHMNILRRTCETMCNSIEAGGRSFLRDVTRFLPNLADDLLRPALDDTLIMQDKWPNEVELLFLLSLFDKECGVDFELIKVECDMLDDPGKMLEKLGTCSWVSEPKRRGNDESTLYFVNPIIHLAVLAWIEENEGNEGFLRRYNKTLSMMFRIYDKKKRASKMDKLNPTSKASIIGKLNLMDHFEQFFRFVCRTSKTFDFTLYDRAVQAIATFANVFLDDGRHDDAIKLLEFARKHFMLEHLRLQPDEEGLRHPNVYFDLGRRLAKAYLSRPKDTLSRDLLAKAEDLINDLREEVKNIGNTEQWTERTLIDSNLSLDLVRISWERDCFSKALEQLKEITSVNVIVSNGKASLPAQEEEYHFQKKEDEEKFLQKRQRLAIRVKREEGLLNLRIGQDHKRKGNELSKAKSAWQAAQGALRDAKIAANSWFSKDIQLCKTIDLYLAEADTMVETGERLDTAMLNLTRHLEQLYKDNGNECRQAWDVECKLNAGRLRQGGHYLDVAEESLNRLLEGYVNSLGVNDDRTLGCAALLRDVYHKKGQKTKVHNISDEFALPALEKSCWDSGVWPAREGENGFWVLTSVFVSFIAVLGYGMIRGGRSA